jgi:cytochrome c
MGTTRCATGISALVLLFLSSAAVTAEDVEHGRRIFQACASCHTIDGEHSTFGPSLKGILGRRAASAPDYRYSPAMQAAGANGLVWDEAALAEFLTKPQAKVPGTTMRFWGLWKRELDDLIAFLKAAGAAR